MMIGSSREEEEVEEVQGKSEEEIQLQIMLRQLNELESRAKQHFCWTLLPRCSSIGRGHVLAAMQQHLQPRKDPPSLLSALWNSIPTVTMMGARAPSPKRDHSVALLPQTLTEKDVSMEGLRSLYLVAKAGKFKEMECEEDIPPTRVFIEIMSEYIDLNDKVCNLQVKLLCEALVISGFMEPSSDDDEKEAEAKAEKAEKVKA